MDIIIFEGAHETLVGAAASVNKLVEDWFLNGDRNLDEYDISITDGAQGVMVSAKTVADLADYGNTNVDIVALMPNVLRKALIAKGLLEDEEDAA